MFSMTNFHFHISFSLCLFIMAARQVAGRRPLYFTADVSILLLTSFLFFVA